MFAIISLRGPVMYQITWFQAVGVWWGLAWRMLLPGMILLASVKLVVGFLAAAAGVPDRHIGGIANWISLPIMLAFTVYVVRHVLQRWAPPSASDRDERQ